MSKKEYLWDCKRCGLQGNGFVFLRLYHERALSTTTWEDYKKLAAVRRGIDAKILQKFRLAKDGFRWLIPYYNGNDRLVGLRYWQEGDKIKNLPGTRALLFNMMSLQEKGPVFICEGEWDVMSLYGAFVKAGIHIPPIVGVPGICSFSDRWLEWLSGRDVWLFFDKEQGIAAQCVEKTAGKLRRYANRVYVLKWKAELPDKYDVRDHLCSKSQKPEEAIRELIGMAEPFKGEISLKDVLEVFEEEFYFPEKMRLALLVCLAALLSSDQDGDPLWLFLVGPPGSGKSLLLEALTIPNHTEYASKITPHALVSGFRVKGKKDTSFLPALRGKALIIKDYTYTLTLPVSQQEELYGLLRDAYDGSLKSVYGNTVVRDYHGLSFSIIAGVTPVIYAQRRSILGERFLKVRIIDSDTAHSEHVLAALEGNEEKNRKIERVRAVLSKFVNAIKLQGRPQLDMTPYFTDFLLRLSRFVALMRAEICRDHTGVLIKPQPEVGSRLAIQFHKLAANLCWLLGYRSLDERIAPYLRSVAMDTIHGYNLDVVLSLSREKDGLPSAVLSRMVKLSEPSLSRKLADLLELGILSFRWENRNRIWRLTAKTAQDVTAVLRNGQVSELVRKKRKWNVQKS